MGTRGAHLTTVFLLRDFNSVINLVCFVATFQNWKKMLGPWRESESRELQNTVTENSRTTVLSISSGSPQPTSEWIFSSVCSQHDLDFWTTFNLAQGVLIFDINAYKLQESLFDKFYWIFVYGKRFYSIFVITCCLCWRQLISVDFRYFNNSKRRPTIKQLWNYQSCFLPSLNGARKTNSSVTMTQASWWRCNEKWYMVP